MAKEFLRFEEIPNPGKATKQFDAISISRASVLGTIKWYGPWRQYCFEPNDFTIWSDGCLEQIAEFLKKLNQEHKQSLKAKAIHD